MYTFLQYNRKLTLCHFVNTAINKMDYGMIIETSPVNISPEVDKENLPRGGLLVVSATEK